MCWGLHIMEGDKVVKRMETVGDVLAFFGPEHVRFCGDDYTPPPVDPVKDHDCCLCPLDKDHLLERTGYVRVEDERWDSMDTRIEKRK